MGVELSKYVLVADCIKTPLGGVHIKIAYIRYTHTNGLSIYICIFEVFTYIAVCTYICICMYVCSIY